MLPSAAVQWSTPTVRDWKDGACAEANVPTNGLLGRQAARLGNSDGQGQRQYSGEFSDVGGRFRGAAEALWPPRPDDWSAWQDWYGPKPAVRRDADGLANRVDQLRLCGGGVVPQQAAYAFNLMRERVTND
jgi:hypothetical protein